MHDGGGGGDFGGHHGGHADGDSGLTSHHTPAHHRADGQFTPWNSTPVGHESFRPRRGGGGPGGNPVIFWVIVAVAAFAIVMVFAAH